MLASCHAPDRQRALLLAACRAVLYTPQHEHFGIVPLEAMAARRPVVAVNSGGPVESVGSAAAAAAAAAKSKSGGRAAGGNAGSKAEEEGVKDGNVGAGFLCEPTAAAFAGAMRQLMDAGAAREMGAAARAHVEGGFSRRAFGEQLDGYVRGLVGGVGGERQGRGKGEGKKER